MALCSLRTAAGGAFARHFARTSATLEVRRHKSTKDGEYFRDPDRFRRLLNPKEANFTRDGFDVQRERPRHGLGDFRTPHPGSYPDLPRDYDDRNAEEDWANTAANSEDELKQLEYKFVVPNFETENFSFDAEHGILQEAEDEREFYERVVVPKTQDLAFRKLAQEIPLDSQDEKVSGYQTSKDPQEWAFVERLSPVSEVTPSQFEYKEYPSGFIPPNPAVRADATNMDYFVGRTKFSMLPVYTDYVRTADKVETSVRKCEGNLYKLRDDMQAFLFERYEQEFPSQVAELYGRIKFAGDFEQDFKEFLLSKGF